MGPRHVRFPVVMLLSGAYSGDTTMYRKLDFARLATMAIRTGKVAPFVAVYPRLNDSLTLDTECVDSRAGSRASRGWRTTSRPGPRPTCA